MNKTFEGKCSCVFMNTTYLHALLNFTLLDHLNLFHINSFLGDGALSSTLFDLVSFHFATLFFLLLCCYLLEQRMLGNVTAGCS